MDKITQYQQHIRHLLEQYTAHDQPDDPIQSRIIIDDEHKRYCVINIGWRPQQHIHNLLFHFDIINEKIWLQANWTDWDVTEDLMEMGVPKSDIVLGFLPEDIRGDEGFGVG